MLYYQENHKQKNLIDLLHCVSLNPAKEIGLDANYGSFDVGKNPGVNLISGVDFQEMKLTSNSKVKRLL